MSYGKIFFSLRGRINRKTYWLSLISMIFLYVIAQTMIDSSDESMQVYGSFFMLSLIWPSIAVQVKRWHDRNKSGWWQFIQAIPLIGPFWVIIELGFLKGTPGPNSYGFPQNTKTQGDYSDIEDLSGTRLIPDPIPDMISMFAKIAKSDGAISRSEVRLVDDFFYTILRLTPAMRKEAIMIFNNAKDSSVPYEIYAKRLYLSYKDTPKLLELVVDFLLALAAADGSLSSEEHIIIAQTIEIFGLESELYENYKEEAEKEEPSFSEKHREKYYCDVLGIQQDFEPYLIKKIYRNLAMQYHPDKVAQMGPKIREVAEREMKKINEAYKYFKLKYEIV